MARVYSFQSRHSSRSWAPRSAVTSFSASRANFCILRAVVGRPLRNSPRSRWRLAVAPFCHRAVRVALRPPAPPPPCRCQPVRPEEGAVPNALRCPPVPTRPPPPDSSGGASCQTGVARGRMFSARKPSGCCRVVAPCHTTILSGVCSISFRIHLSSPSS